MPKLLPRMQPDWSKWLWGPTVAAPLVIALVTLLNLVYLQWFCPHDLSPDEAHYWDWSRHLAWCYYSKGPLVAWLIRLSTELFGVSPFAVRLPACLCGSLILLGLWRLSLLAFGSPRQALLVVVFAATLPPFAATSLLMTIDPPFLACWVWATVAVLKRNGLAAGVLVAIGTLAKLTMLLFPLGVIGLCLVQPGDRTWNRLGALAVAMLGTLPVLLWNATHDWLGVRHLVGHLNNGDVPNAPYSPLVFLAGQCGLLMGVWFGLWLLAVWRFRKTSERAVAVLWWCSVPVFVVFALASFKTAGQVNWSAAAYLGGFVLAVNILDSWPGTWRKSLLMASLLLVGLIGSVVIRWPQLVRPVMAALVPAPTAHAGLPIRRLDPTARLAGWRTLAAAVDEVRAEVKASTGEEPLLATMVWTVPGELGFYCTGRPTVYSFGVALADRTSQYDAWRPNPVADAQDFAGRTFVYVGEQLPDGVFEQCVRVQTVTHGERGIPLASWTIWIGSGYRGFGTVPPTRTPRF